MIQNFGVISKSGKKLESKIGININMYNNTDDKDSIELFNLKGNGIFWSNNSKEYVIFPGVNSRIIAYPSVDLSHIVAIYSPVYNNEFLVPRNAVIYNEVGEIVYRPDKSLNFSTLITSL